MSEIIFLVEESDEGGYIARALGESIITQAESKEELRVQVKDAVQCHFEPEDCPDILRLHFIKDETFALK